MTLRGITHSIFVDGKEIVIYVNFYQPVTLERAPAIVSTVPRMNVTVRTKFHETTDQTEAL